MHLNPSMAVWLRRRLGTDRGSSVTVCSVFCPPIQPGASQPSEAAALGDAMLIFKVHLALSLQPRTQKCPLQVNFRQISSFGARGQNSK